MAEAGQIVVTGIGMRTAVGEHAIQTCASIRAGINRFAEWPHFGQPLDLDGTALVASAVQPDLGKGSWTRKARKLLTMPFYEAIVDAGLFDFDEVRRRMGEYRAGVYLGAPRPDRPGSSEDALERFLSECGEKIFAPFSPVRTDIFALDQVGGAAALAAAVADLRESQIDVAIVGGVDSFLDLVFLRSLHEAQRLKTPASAAGLIPGEAAAFAILERTGDASRRGVRSRLRIGVTALEGSKLHADDPHEPLDRPNELAAALRAVLARLDASDLPRYVITDLNGERWRFREWGLAETRCLADLPDRWELWHPADCVGDVGAAFVPLAVGVATRAFERGHGLGDSMLICAGADQGERCAVAVLAPANGG